VCTGGATVCDPLAQTGCQAGFSCQINIPYASPSDVSCRPAGIIDANAACSPTALCKPGEGCVLSSPSAGVCRVYCDLSAPNCLAGETCKSINDPTIGICSP
jgi:hypothetical protein